MAGVIMVRKNRIFCFSSSLWLLHIFISFSFINIYGYVSFEEWSIPNANPGKKRVISFYFVSLYHRAWLLTSLVHPSWIRNFLTPFQFYLKKMQVPIIGGHLESISLVWGEGVDKRIDKVWFVGRARCKVYHTFQRIKLSISYSYLP